MTRSEAALLTLLVLAIALTVFATVGFELHHFFAHLQFSTSQGGS